MAASALDTRVFISYSSADKAFVHWLADSLETLDIPIWIDYAEIRVGDSIVERISEGLGRSDTLIIVLSAASVESRWVKEELNSAFFQSVSNRQVRILPALIEHCNVPFLIRQLRYANFASNREAGLTELLEALVPDRPLREEADLLLRRAIQILKELQIASLTGDRLTVPDAETPPGRLPGTVPVPDRLHVYELLTALNRLLNRALYVKFQLLVRDDVKNLSALGPQPDFEAQFEYLLCRGLDLRSQAWQTLRDFRNSFLHGTPSYGIRVDPKDTEYDTKAREVDARAKQVLAQLPEISRVIGTIGGPSSEARHP